MVNQLIKAHRKRKEVFIRSYKYGPVWLSDILKGVDSANWRTVILPYIKDNEGIFKLLMSKKGIVTDMTRKYVGNFGSSIMWRDNMSAVIAIGDPDKRIKKVLEFFISLGSLKPEHVEKLRGN